MSHALIPIFIFLGGFAMIFGIYYLRTRENLAMLEKGFNPKENQNRPAPFRSLKTGLLYLGAGTGLLIAYIVNLNISFRDQDNPALYFALIAIGGGLGLVVSYSIEKKEYFSRKP